MKMSSLVKWLKQFDGDMEVQFVVPEQGGFSIADYPMLSLERGNTHTLVGNDLLVPDDYGLVFHIRDVLEELGLSQGEVDKLSLVANKGLAAHFRYMIDWKAKGASYPVTGDLGSSGVYPNWFRGDAEQFLMNYLDVLSDDYRGIY